MSCSVCGNAYPCAHSGLASILLESDRLGHEYKDHESEGHQSNAHKALDGSSQRFAVSVEGSGRIPSSSASGEDNNWPMEQAWRQEVASRVRQHRARRRKRSDPNAMELDFPAEAPISFAATQQDEFRPPQPLRVEAVEARTEPPKIIRFPRPAPAYTPVVRKIAAGELELAEPVWGMPRILDSPEATAEGAPEAEQMELLPSFADIRLDAEESRTNDDEEDWLPQPAPLSQRFVAGLVDAGIVFVATGAFVLTFLKLAEDVPQSRLIALCGLATGGVLWLLFQFVFLVYARTTPGMHMAQLELAAFEGKPVSLFARRCRALASTLSCFSLGLGYAWALVDEDRLGWHDRISQTYVRTEDRVIG
jgi:uncharacterized RDD family membrane protein YckC